MPLFLRLILFLSISLWILGIITEWLIPAKKEFLVALPILKKSYSVVCHQQECKLISFQGKESFVCSRCAGIYIGFWIVSLISLIKKELKKPGLNLLIVAALPMLLDVILYQIGLYSYNKAVAFLTGFLLGWVGFLYFYSALNELILERKKKSA